MITYSSENTFVKPSEKHGLGVFAKFAFKENERIEIAPVIHYEDNNVEKDYFVSNYAFRNVGLNNENLVSVVLGNGSLYNHSFKPNVEFIFFEDSVEVYALTDIIPGDELLINYGKSFWVGLEGDMK